VADLGGDLGAGRHAGAAQQEGHAHHAVPEAQLVIEIIAVLKGLAVIGGDRHHRVVRDLRQEGAQLGVEAG
jgi:hypothetical protein